MSDPSQDWSIGQSTQRLKPALYIVATPIGNLRDITLRALDVLQAADCIYCEDTRVTQRLLSVFGLHKKLERCDAHTEKRQTEDVIAAIRQGKIIVFVSDAGTPGISDPGTLLVKACHEAGVLVSPVPGASAAIAAVSVAGLNEEMPFTFLGFLPQKSGARRKILQHWQTLGSALVLYEAPQRVADVLEDVQAMWGSCDVLIARELTKLHENFYQGTPAELQTQIAHADFKGEVVMVLTPAAQAVNEWTDDKIDQALTALLPAMSLKEAVAQVTAQSGLSRKIVYARALGLERHG